MRTYTRARVPGGSYFFTVNLAERQDSDLLVRQVAHLREAFRLTRHDHPFDIEAMVVLPEHLHCIWRLPENDSDFPTRWRLIKARFSRFVQPGERITASRARGGERGIWQRRFWEHLIRDERDWRRHVDYIHFNPVKHGLTTHPIDWPFSSIHRFARERLCDPAWTADPMIIEMDLE